jgi:hypothetical protein
MPRIGGAAVKPMKNLEKLDLPKQASVKQGFWKKVSVSSVTTS